MKRLSVNENRISRKLRSETGASITYALLLFLVCAALSAVILVAATTASGRMSRIAETDQKYYAVTSAAELLRDMMDGQSVSMVKMKNSEDYTFFRCPMTEVTNLSFGEDFVDTAAGADLDVADGAGTAPVSDSDKGMTETIAKMIATNTFNDSTWTLSAKKGTLGNGALIPSLTVNVSGTQDAAGNLELTVSSAGDHPYSLILKFASDVQYINPSISDLNSIESGENGPKEVTWHLIGMASNYDYNK